MPLLARPRTHSAVLPEPRFVASYPTVRAAMRQVERAAARRLPILIRDETGTGKDLLARHAHQASAWPGLFVPVNCGAPPATLIESELFGYADGAFTGARRHAAKGLVEQAHGGTLFFDEIGNTPIDLQAVLLRLPDDWTVRPVGGQRGQEVDVLLVAATNADLEQRIEEGLFRADLLYRLNIAEVHLPRLAERSDFAAIATVLLAGIEQRLRLSPEALAALERRRWPGNIRELRNALARLALSCEAAVIYRELVSKVLGPDPGSASDTARPGSLREEVRAHIERVFCQEAGNMSRTARNLNVSRNTVYRAVRRELSARG